MLVPSNLIETTFTVKYHELVYGKSLVTMKYLLRDNKNPTNKKDVV